MGEGLDLYDTVYDSGYQPSLDDAVSVLAFVLTSLKVFVSKDDDPEETAAAAEVLFSAKEEVLCRWQRHRAAALDAARMLM